MKYHCVKQHDLTDCGAACLATVSKQYGLKISITQIREIAGTDRRGTNAYGLVQAAQSLGFQAKGVKGDHGAFFSDFPLPCIAHVVMDEALLHYVVIHKITEKQVIVADPGKGIVKYTPEEFFKTWTGVLIFLVPANTFQKDNKTKTVFGRFFGLLIPQKRLIANVFLTSLLYTALGILGSFYFMFLMDEILPNDLAGTLTIVSIGIILLHVFKSLLSFFRGHLLLYLSQKLDLSLLFGYYQHVLKLPMNFFGTRKIGEIISRFQDASNIRELMSTAVMTVMIDTLMAIAGGIILYIQSPFLFAITAIIAIIYAIIVFSFNKPLRRVHEEQMESNAQLSSYMIESLNGIETIKSFNSEAKVEIQTESKFIKLLKAVFKGGVLTNISGTLANGVGAIGGVIIIWAGATAVLNGNLTVGQLLTFNALLAYFLEPIKNLINLQPTMQSAIVASDRLGEILDLDLEKSDHERNKATPTLQGDIEINDLDFRYGTRPPVLKDINLSVKYGEKVALVGESGSGKTTLAKLMIHFYEPERGSITINGYHTKDINMAYLRQRVAYISQDMFLFSGTILDNLKFGNADATLEDVIEVCKQARAHDFINNLPLRYETWLDENGSNLSVGQRQRLAIARALLKRPEVLIMDEATSNLDSVTERAIERTINENMCGVTTIIIAHRLSTIMACDKIYVMENGSICESGSHFELMAQKGVYYTLWKEQIPKEASE